MYNDNLTPGGQKSERRIWPIVLVAFCFIFSAAAGALLASSSIFDLKKEPITPIERINTDTELIKARDKSTILIMGVDVRKDDTGRSDTMMIATVDPKYDQASLLSIPRDTRVRIYGYGYDKINAAFAYGGEPLAEKTVENFLGIDIDHYIIIDTGSFVKIIDAIGGIDIDVEKRMKYSDPWDDNGGLYINIYPGKQHMDGKKAVTYVRYRDSEGDIGRIKRQQAFIEACMDKVMSPTFIPRIPAVIREVADAIDTDMTFRQLMELAGALKAANKNGLETDMVPGYPLYIDEISYWIPYIDELQYTMARMLDVSVDNKLKERVEKLAGEYHDSIPATAREIPEGAEHIGESIPRSNYYDDSPTYNDNRNEDYEEPRYNDSRNDDYEEPRYNDSRNDDYEEPRYNDSRNDDYYEEPRHNDNRNDYYDEPRYNDSRNDDYYEEPRHNDNRNDYYEEPRYNDNRNDYYEEPRYNDSRNDDYYEESRYNDSRNDDYYDEPRYNDNRNDYYDEPRYNDNRNDDYYDEPRYDDNRNDDYYDEPTYNDNYNYYDNTPYYSDTNEPQTYNGNLNDYNNERDNYEYYDDAPSRDNDSYSKDR